MSPGSVTPVFEVKAIVPEPWDAAKVVAGLKRSMQVLANAVKADFEATVSSWEERAEFITDVTEEGGNLVTRIYTDSDRWRMLNEGTSPRVIMPSAGGVIAFRPEFTPKTTPRVFGSSGGSRGGEMVFVRSVRNNPGITPREWTLAALDKYSPQIAVHAQQGLFLGMWAATKGYKSEVVSG